MACKDVTWFEKKLEQYPSSQDHNRDLIEFVEEFKKLDDDKRRSYVATLLMEPMLRMVVKWNNPVYADPFFELVQLIFTSMSAVDVVSKYDFLLDLFLYHVAAKFQDLTCSVLERVLTEQDGMDTLYQHSKLVETATCVLVYRPLNKETPCFSTPCWSFLTKLALEAPRGTQLVFTGESGSTLANYADRIDPSRTVHQRIFELVTAAVLKSKEALDAMRDCELFQLLLESIQNSMNDMPAFGIAVEICTTLTGVEYGYDFIKDFGILSKLEERIVEYQPGMEEDIFIESVFEFFGENFKRYPVKMAADTPTVVPLLLEIILMPLDRKCVLFAAMGAIAGVGSTIEGKAYLHSLEPLLERVLARAMNFIVSGYPEEQDKIHLMSMMASLLSLKPEDHSQMWLERTEQWFVTAFSTELRVWKELQECSSKEYKKMILEVVLSMSMLPWGKRRLANIKGFDELITSNEEDLLLLEVKKRILQNCVV